MARREKVRNDRGDVVQCVSSFVRTPRKRGVCKGCYYYKGCWPEKVTR